MFYYYLRLLFFCSREKKLASDFYSFAVAVDIFHYRWSFYTALSLRVFQFMRRIDRLLLLALIRFIFFKFILSAWILIINCFRFGSYRHNQTENRQRDNNILTAKLLLDHHEQPTKWMMINSFVCGGTITRAH